MYSWLKGWIYYFRQSYVAPVASLNNGRLHIPAVRVALSGKIHELTLQRVPGKRPATFELISMEPSLAQLVSSLPAEVDQEIEFRCNICGQTNLASLFMVSSREARSCSCCGSSLRMRSIIHVLSLALFAKSFLLQEFPQDKKIIGLGMSDWVGYAEQLASKLDYINTFYHQEPKLDINDITGWCENRYDFIISSDVLEHVPPPVAIAFKNIWRLLKPGGVFVFTVPFTKAGITQEHFPELHDYRIDICDNRRILVNRTRDGREQIFKNLVFHGGDGATLEMRQFSESSVVDELRQAGFKQIHIHIENQVEIGVIWPTSWSVPITAIKCDC